MSIRRLALLSLAAAALLVAQALAPSRAAAQANPYVVPDVPISATAESGDQAREQAIAAGQAEALRRLWEKLTPQAYWGRVPALPRDALPDLVRDFSLAGEQTGGDSYAARLTMSFDGELARAHLREHGVPYSKVVAPPLVVLPLFGPARQASLWDGENPWRTHWQQRAPDKGLVPLVTPLGDVEDLATIDAQRALARDAGALAAIAERYGASGVLLLRAEIKGDPAAGAAELSVEARLSAGGDYPGPATSSFRQTAGESLELFLARAADAVARPLEERWKQDHLLVPGELKTLEAAIAVSSLEEWIDVQQRIDAAAVVDRSLPRVLSRNEVIVAIDYFGHEAGLARALEQQALALSPEGATAAPQSPVTAVAPVPGPAATGPGAAAVPAAETAPRWRLSPLHGGGSLRGGTAGGAVTVTE